MDTSKLRKFASFARSALIEQVGTRLKTVLAEKSMARRESPKAISELEVKIKEVGEKRLIETVAYTWFNRFCALRYMDVNRYTRIGVISPAEGQFQPEILAEAKMGHIDDELVPEATRRQVMRLLDGSDKSADPQGEAYRLLLVAVCNYYHALMPFMFEKIADYTELLLPEDLLSGTSIPAYTREALLPINCSPEHTEESVEVIGWLYQFYIADKKDEVFDSLKKGKKITAENIPAATQLFTPHWIVRYLLENSLGRLWMLNHPDSKLVERMDYYIKPEEPEADFLKIASPEEIKVCDPACGSGHMLTYAFDLLYEIYREEQYPEPEIPSLILRNNLYGIEIDQRAGALAAFALTMKAREKDKRFFTRKSKPDAPARDFSSIDNPKSQIQNPNICVLENISIDPEDLSACMDKVGRDLFSGGLQGVVNQWKEADNFGSLIRPLVTDVSDVLELLRERQMGPDLFLAGVHHKVLKALRQADYLSPKYHVVVANPPYMGSGGMNASIRQFVAEHYTEAKSDILTCFMERASELCVSHGFWGMINLPSWMFLSSFEKFRKRFLERSTIQSLIHNGRGIFGSDFGSLAFICLNEPPTSRSRGVYRRLFEKHVDVRNMDEIEALFLDPAFQRFVVRQAEFHRIPGSPIAYWASDATRQAFTHSSIERFGETRRGLQTGDGPRFIRFWHETALNKSGYAPEAKKWFFMNNGGAFRRWFGNTDYVVNWANNGAEIKATGKAIIPNEHLYFKRAVTWSRLTASTLSFRIHEEGIMPGDIGPCIYSQGQDELMLGLLNSKAAAYLLNVINPTVTTPVGDVAKLPVPEIDRAAIKAVVGLLVGASKRDWNAHETSYEFESHPLTRATGGKRTFHFTINELRDRQKATTLEVRELEIRNNTLFSAAYGFTTEVDTEVRIEDVSILSNPAFRYGSDKSESELEALLLADTMREYISYAVGCMFGRYSLDKPGLILANQGETTDDYRRQVPEPTFAPDEDNVIPILEGEWFTDDVSQRFKEFLKVTFGTEHYEENLKFLEDALYPENPTAKKRKTIRDYFLKEFYDHHLKLYKKRPIYWLFSSPKGTFSALIYMHRYRSDTVGTVLHYLRDFRDKLTHHAEHQQMLADSASASKSEKTQAIKDVANIKKQLKELEEYEKSLFEVASKMRNVDLDLDDGVKHNYLLFGSVLRKIPGLDAKED